MAGKIDDGGAAFPRVGFSGQFGHAKPESGLSARQYAAIKLRVPNSGTEWLDDMIRDSLRDQFAGQALAGILASEAGNNFYSPADASGRAYRMADAMIAARKEKPHD